MTVLPVVNTGIALGVVFDMVTKPASVPVALGVIGIGIVSSILVGRRQRPAPIASIQAAAPNENRASAA